MAFLLWWGKEIGPLKDLCRQKNWSQQRNVVLGRPDSVESEAQKARLIKPSATCKYFLYKQSLTSILTPQFCLHKPGLLEKSRARGYLNRYV